MPWLVSKGGLSRTRRLRRFVRISLSVASSLSYDAWRFVRWSGIYRQRKNEASLAALITMQYHRIEKGLALPQPNPGFGEAGIKELCDLICETFAKNICLAESALAADAIFSYREFNLSHGLSPHPWIEAALAAARRAGLDPKANALKPGLAVDSESSHLDFLVSRTSVRQFSDSPVPDSVLDNAVLAAQHAPCVCNRQAGRVYLLKDEGVRKLALSFQNGNRGFGHSAPVVAIITIDQAEMVDPTERYQHWIDGGMFAQNFLLGIHAQGYGACPLNWSAPASRDASLRKSLGLIPKSETVIMMIAIGALSADYIVARSERRLKSQVVITS